MSDTAGLNLVSNSKFNLPFFVSYYTAKIQTNMIQH